MVHQYIYGKLNWRHLIDWHSHGYNWCVNLKWSCTPPQGQLNLLLTEPGAACIFLRQTNWKDQINGKFKVKLQTSLDTHFHDCPFWHEFAAKFHHSWNFGWIIETLISGLHSQNQSQLSWLYSQKCNPDIKFPYLIHFCSPVQLVVRFWPNEAMSANLQS